MDSLQLALRKTLQLPFTFSPFSVCCLHKWNQDFKKGFWQKRVHNEYHKHVLTEIAKSFTRAFKTFIETFESVDNDQSSDDKSLVKWTIDYTIKTILVLVCVCFICEH